MIQLSSLSRLPFTVIATLSVHYQNGVLPQLRSALRTELGVAVGLGAAVGAELMRTVVSGGE